MTVAGLLLAAGAGRRMGGPKALVRLVAGGPTLVESAVERLLAAGCDRAVVVVGAGADEAAAAVAGTGAEVVTAADWSSGMGASLDAGLAHLEAGPDDLALVTLVDLPDVTADVMARVLTAAVGRRAGGPRAGGLRRGARSPGRDRPRPLGRCARRGAR